MKTTITGTTITFDYGTTGKLLFDASRAQPPMRAYAEMHGWKQRLMDTAALGRDTTTGKSATDAEKIKLQGELISYYENGAESWTRKANVVDNTAVILQAICLLKGVGEDAARSYVQHVATKRGEEFKDAARYLVSGSLLGEAIARLKAQARGQSAVDADEELNGLIAE